MEIDTFREICLSQKDATEDTPFGPETLVFRVGGKMFALASLDDIPATVNLKSDPDRALQWRDQYEEVRPGYHMNKKHWNTVQLGAGVPDRELHEMIAHSYDLVRRSLTKAQRAELERA